jgi:DNA helicase-2/ATP-dependent DNA helicase PcrA
LPVLVRLLVYTVGGVITPAARVATVVVVGDIATLYRAANVGDVFADPLAEAGYDYIRVDYDYIRVDNAVPCKKVGLTTWVEDCAAWCAGGWRFGYTRARSIELFQYKKFPFGA